MRAYTYYFERVMIISKNIRRIITWLQFWPRCLSLEALRHLLVADIQSMGQKDLSHKLGNFTALLKKKTAYKSDENSLLACMFCTCTYKRS